MKRIIVLLFIATVLLAGCRSYGFSSNNTTATTNHPALQGTSEPTDVSEDATTVPTEPSSPPETATITEPSVPPETTTPTEPSVSVEPPEPVEPEPLDAELEQEIIDRYIALHAKDSDTEITVRLDYFGTYDGAVVAFIDSSFCSYVCEASSEFIGPWEFSYRNGQRMDVYKDGEFLPLKDAYSAGWLSEEGLAQLFAWYRCVRMGYSS